MDTKSGNPLSKIGIGSFGIGGYGHRDVPITGKLEDKVYVDALVHTLNKGANFIEISLGYGHGDSISLFKQALDKSQVSREDVFITNSLYPRDLPEVSDIHRDLDDFHKIMETNYADSTLVTQTMMLEFGEDTVYGVLHDLIESGKTRYVSLSNASPNWVKRFYEEFGDKFVAHEGHISYEIRAMQDKGVFDVCRELGVENIIWRPLRKNKTVEHSWEELTDLAKKYGKTQNQIVLNWMCHEGYHPMVMSTNPTHIDENFEALTFKMNESDYEIMNNFRPKNYTPYEIDWEGEGIDVDIVGMVADVDKIKNN